MIWDHLGVPVGGAKSIKKSRFWRSPVDRAGPMITDDLGPLGGASGGCEKYQEKQVLARPGKPGRANDYNDDLGPLGGASGGCEKYQEKQVLAGPGNVISLAGPKEGGGVKRL